MKHPPKIVVRKTITMKICFVVIVALQILGHGVQGTFLDEIVDKGAKGLDKSVKGVQQGIKGVKDGAGIIGDGVKGGVDSIGGGIKQGIDAVGGGVKKGADAVEDGVKKSVDGIAKGIKQLVPDCLFGVDKISFVLFTKRQYPKGIVVGLNDTTLPVEKNAPVRFLVHGFTSDANTTNYFDMATTWTKLEERAHIFSVQWKEGACTTGGLPLLDLLSYPMAVTNTREVGVLVANFTRRLVEEYGVSVSETIVAGHSLGSHVSGFAGKELQRLGLGKLRMIIGLDTAGPGWESSDCADRLCKTDANLVQILHTSYILGIHGAIGHIDFYINSATMQPGCILEPCNHSRSAEYFTESLRNPNCIFLGVPYINGTRKVMSKSECTPETCIPAGLAVLEYPARGTFYVSTTSKPPFCMDSEPNF